MEELAANISKARNTVGATLRATAPQVSGRLPVNASSLLQPLDDAAGKAAENNDQALLDRLTQAKNAITTIFSAGKDGKVQPVGSRLLDKLTYQEGVLLKQKIGDLTKWTGQRTEDETVNGALTRTYGTLKSALNSLAETSNPEQAKALRKLNEQYADLTSAEIATKYRDVLQQRQNMINLPGKLGLTASALAAPFTGGVSALVGAGASIAADKALSSPAFKTRAAAALAKVPALGADAERTFRSPGDLIAGATNKLLPKAKGTVPISTLLGAAGATGAAALATRPSKVTATNPAIVPVTKPAIPKIAPPAGDKIVLPDRKVSLDSKDLDTLRKTLFAEISNRSGDKQELEARTIINTALNRLSAGHGGAKTLTDVLTAPKQYQGYGSKEYQRLASGKTGKADEPKLKAIDAVIAELKSGNFPDNVEGRQFYTHDKTGKITATSTF